MKSELLLTSILNTLLPSVSSANSITSSNINEVIKTISFFKRSQ